ncbi:MAG: 4-hydroxythreonine-4-phosphate dehydrogenase PdxA, partial [Nitrosomonadales bacterium]|nr:4-hydroxythreonine-4-phosphate dehydrogenase PdxA [Nitrosomonadales bacterium]
MKKPLPRIAVTAGEPAGIGPDLCVMLAHRAIAAEIIVIADEAVLQQRANTLGLALKTTISDASSHRGDGSLNVLHQPANQAVVAGQLDKANSQYVLNTLITATDGCVDGSFDAMVTAPVHKGVINQADIAFTGHTEFLAEHTHTKQVVMML